MTQEEKFQYCQTVAQRLVQAYRDEAPEGVDPQGSYIAIGLAAASVVTAGVGAYSSSKSAREQAKGEEERSANLLKLFGERDPGAFSLEGLEGLAGFEVNVNPMDFMQDGGKLTDWAMDFMRAQAETTFEQTVRPENVPLFNQFVTDNLERANFDFSSVPAEIMRTVEGSALSRAIGGPAGMAENLSVENKIRLQQTGENSAFRALGFRQGFMPDLLNPIDSVMGLATFERQNQIASAEVQMGALGALGNLEMQRFGLEAGFQAPNVAGIGAAANANNWNAASGALMTGASMAMMYGNSYGAQNPNQAQGANMNSYGQQQYASSTPDWRTNATSTYNPNSVYYRG